MIFALVDAKSQAAHSQIPYRDSKLTRLLQVGTGLQEAAVSSFPLAPIRAGRSHLRRAGSRVHAVLFGALSGLSVPVTAAVPHSLTRVALRSAGLSWRQFEDCDGRQHRARRPLVPRYAGDAQVPSVRMATAVFVRMGRRPMLPSAVAHSVNRRRPSPSADVAESRCRCGVHLAESRESRCRCGYGGLLSADWRT